MVAAAATGRRLQSAAIIDFDAALPALDVTGRVPSGMNQGSTADQLGYAALAAVELFRLTRAGAYRDAAVRLGRAVLTTQEAQFVAGIALAGYFYEDTHRTGLTHEFHSSFEDGRLLALEALCDALPAHPDWMDWYLGLVTYSEYFCVKGSEASAPFEVLAAAVWRRQDVEGEVPPDRAAALLASKPNPLFPTPPDAALVRQHLRQQYADAAPLGPDHRLRVFPLWFDHVRHGSSVVQLSKAIGLAAAATARRRGSLHQLAERQLQWVLGLNPFSRSLMYGVGYDWWQNFTVEVPNLVGGLPVGMNSYSGDAPAWGNNAVFPYKEIWVLASCRAASLLAALLAPPRSASPALGARATVSDGVVVLTLPASSRERAIELRCANLAGGGLVRTGAAGLTRRLPIADARRPWAIVLVPDGNLTEREELFGTAQPLAPIA